MVRPCVVVTHARCLAVPAMSGGDRRRLPRHPRQCAGDARGEPVAQATGLLIAVAGLAAARWYAKRRAVRSARLSARKAERPRPTGT